MPSKYGLLILIDVPGSLDHAQILDAVPGGCMCGAVDRFRYLRADGPAHRNVRGHA